MVRVCISGGVLRGLQCLLLVLVMVCVRTSATELSLGNKEMRLFFSATTTTETAISFATTVVPFTCFSTAAVAVTCAGRKLRRAAKKSIIGEDFISLTDIESSIALDPVLLPVEEDPTSDGRLFFSKTRFTTTTITATTTSTDTSTTVSLSALCTFPGFIGPLC